MTASLAITKSFSQNSVEKISKRILWNQSMLKMLFRKSTHYSMASRTLCSEASWSRQYPTTEKNTFSTPKLFNVPALPYIGSLISMHSGLSLPNPEQPFSHFISNRKKFGDFYSWVGNVEENAFCPIKGLQ